MFVVLPTNPPLRFALLALVVAFAGCTSAPEGVTAERSTLEIGPAALWALPDTVSVPVKGEPAEGDLRWEPPKPEQQAWLDENSYDSLSIEYSEAETEELWAERLRTLRGLIGEEHIPEIRESVVRELSIEAASRDELLRIDISDGFEAERFQERLEEELRLQGATRAEVQDRLDSIEAVLEDYKDQQVMGRAYYARQE